MYIKIQAHNPSMDVVGIVEYLDKENQPKRMVEYLDKQNQELEEREKEREYFFNSESDKISKLEVMYSLNENHQGLRGKDAKFFILTASPSQEELSHLERIYGGDKQAMKEYTKEVMRGYAVCMNREVEGRALEEKDLVWYGMYEDSRKYGRKDHEVLHNREYNRELRAISEGRGEKGRLEELGGFYVLDKDGKTVKKMKEEQGEIKIKEGLRKPGKHGHVHILVHRRDKSGKLSLSPLASSRGGEKEITNYYLNGKKITKAKAQELSKKEDKKLGQGSIEIRKVKAQIGFNRSYFKGFCESAFDYKFDYDRKFRDSFEGYNQKKKDPRTYDQSHLHALKQGRIGLLKVGNDLKSHVVDKDLSNGCSTTKTILKEGFKVAKIIASGNPTALALVLVQKGITAPLKLGVKLFKNSFNQL